MKLFFLLLCSANVYSQNVVSILFGNGGMFENKNGAPATTTAAPRSSANKSPLCQYMSWFQSCDQSRLSGVGAGGSGDSSSFGEIDSTAQNAMIQECQNSDCRTQKTEDQVCRDTLMRLISQFNEKFFNRDARIEITRQFTAIYEYKKSLIDKAGLAQYVNPADNGLVDRDILLSEEQATYLINQLKNRKSGRRKRNALFFGGSSNYIKKWDISRPILYNFDPNYTEQEKNLVRQALAMITEGASCIRFQYAPDAESNQHFIFYTYTRNATVCGISDLGRMDKDKDGKGNYIFINYQICDEGNMVGVIAHETMHALGIEHQHQRIDREKHIRILWGKINPMMFDSLIAVDQNVFTTYGIPYDYDSVMHYKSTLGAKNPFISTMEPLKDSKPNQKRMGQRGHLSEGDKEVLKKLYCMPDCDDSYSNCGVWALDGKCKNYRGNKFYRFMILRCRKSCGYCGGTRNY